MRASAVVPFVFVLATGLDGCKPAQTAAPPPPPPRLGPIETPEDIVAQLLVRDAAALLEATAKATGKPELDPSQLFSSSDNDLAAFASAIDLHSPAGGAILGDPQNPDAWRYGIALKVRDPKEIRARAAERVKSGQLKAEDSPAIRTKIYPTAKGAFAFIGEAIVLSDSRATLESAGRWIAREGTEGTPTHDVVLRVPLSRFAVPMQKKLKAAWDSEVKTDREAAAADPFMRSLIPYVAGLGDVELTADVEKGEALIDVRLGATGMLGQWLAKYPAGPVRSILAMPKSTSAYVMRFPDSIAELFKGSQPSEAKDLEDFRTFAAAAGHEIAIATNKKTPDAKTTEVLVRLELIEPAKAKTAFKAFIGSTVAAKPERKLTRAPWAKLGADGESLQVIDGADKYDARWAIKGNFLYLDVAWEGKPTLIEPALDASGKALLGSNPRAKAFADRLPADGLAFAYYAETAKAPRLEELGAVPSLEGVRWGWASGGKSGLTSQWNIPLADLGALFGSDKKAEAPPAGKP